MNKRRTKIPKEGKRSKTLSKIINCFSGNFSNVDLNISSLNLFNELMNKWDGRNAKDRRGRK